MSHIIICEGARGTGKSTVTRGLRNNVPQSTLINFTGFHDDGEKGKRKIIEYYDIWFDTFTKLARHDSTYIFDRFFFSEVVFSRLYKSYNFPSFTHYNKLISLADKGIKIDLFFFTIENEEELKTRLIRDKVKFADISESTYETLKQQDMYHLAFEEFKFFVGHHDNINLHTIKTDSKTAEEIQKEIELLVYKCN